MTVDNIIRVRADQVGLPVIMMRRFVDEIKLEDLTRSIRKLGIIVPLIVKEVEGKLELIAGFRRLMAASRIAGKYLVPVIMIDQENDEEAVKIAENVEREGIGAVDEGEYYRDVMEAKGWNQKDLAREIGMSEAYVSQRIATITWDERTKELVRSREIKWSVARELEKVDDENDRKRLISIAVRSGVTPAVAAEWRRETNRMREELQGELEIQRKDNQPVEKIYVPCQCCEDAVEINQVKYVRVCGDCQTLILNPSPLPVAGG